MIVLYLFYGFISFSSYKYDYKAKSINLRFCDSLQTLQITQTTTAWAIQSNLEEIASTVANVYL